MECNDETKNKDADDASIVVPDRMSVQELRNWLATFGQANKQHFEKGQLLKKQQAAIQSRIQSLEDTLGSSLSITSSSLQSASQFPAGQTTWESPVKAPSASSTEREADPKTRPDVATETIPESVALTSPVMKLCDSSFASPKDDTTSKEERQRSSPESTDKIAMQESSSPQPELELAQTTSSSSLSTTLNDWSSFRQPTRKPYWISNDTRSDVGVDTSLAKESSRLVASQSAFPGIIRSQKPHPLQKTASFPSKVYYFKPVQQRPHMRFVGVEHLLEPPVPSLRPNTWDGDEDEWADDFSEPCFQARPATNRVTRHYRSPAVVSSTEWNEVATNIEEDWTQSGQGSRRNVANVRDELEVDDDCSLLDSSSVCTGSYTDPGHSRGRTSRKNRFPLWLCHNRKPAQDDNDYDDKYNGNADDDTISMPPMGTSYKSPPRPKEFFPDGVLTKSTLDLLCKNDDEKTKAGLTRQIPASPAYSYTSSQQSTTSSSEAPAILPGAIHEDLHAVLAADRQTVTLAVNKWGGGKKSYSRPTTIAQRRRQLQQALERDKPVSHVKRIQWHVCPNTGLYKKKIVVETKGTK